LAQQLGLIYHPRSVLRFEGSEAEPDLMVRRPAPGIDDDWERAPRPILIVEVFSERAAADSARRDLRLTSGRFWPASFDVWLRPRKRSGQQNVGAPEPEDKVR